MVEKYSIKQSFYIVSNKNNGAELMFLLNSGLSHLSNYLSLISSKNLLSFEPKW